MAQPVIHYGGRPLFGRKRIHRKRNELGALPGEHRIPRGFFQGRLWLLITAIVRGVFVLLFEGGRLVRHRGPDLLPQERHEWEDGQTGDVFRPRWF